MEEYVVITKRLYELEGGVVCLRLVRLRQAAKFALTWLWLSKENRNIVRVAVKPNKYISTHFSAMTILVIRKNKHASNWSII